MTDYQSLQCSQPLFVTLLVFLLSVFLLLPSVRAEYELIPSDFLPPLCSSNLTKYGPLVQALESISFQVQSCVSVETSDGHFTDSCTYVNHTYVPFPAQRLDPAVGIYYAEIFRNNPDDIYGLSGITTLNFNLSYTPPGVSGFAVALGRLDTMNSSLDIEWDPSSNVWPGFAMYSYYAEYYQDPASLVPNPLEMKKPVYSYSYVALAPQIATGFWTFHPFWNESCAIAFNTVVKCCIDEQPPLLVLQPYWILLLSTCAYFTASYAYVYLLINLERLACWRSGTKKSWAYVGVATIRLRALATSLSSYASDDDSAAESNCRDGSSRSVDSSRHSPTRKRELKVMDNSLRKLFHQDYVEPLTDPSNQDFVDSTPPSEEAKEAAANSEPEAAAIFANVEQPSSSIQHFAPLQSSFESESLTPLTISERLTSANASYLLLQLLIVCCNFVYILIRVTVLDQSPTDASKTAWWRYQEAYMFWTNSSMVTLLASALASHVFLKYQYYKTLDFHRSASEIADEQSAMERESCRKCYTCGCCCMFCRSRWVKVKLFYRVQLPKEKLICRHIVCAVLLLFSPAIFTHVIPMWLLFFPFLLLVFAILLILMAIVFAVFYVTEISADRAYGNLKEMYNNRINNNHTKEAAVNGERAEISQVDAISSPSKSEAAINLDRIPPVEFPWYAILLLRLLFTITIVVLFQTSYNYGQIIYTYIWPVRNELEGTLILLLWGEPAATEFLKRDTGIWYDSMQNNLHQFLTQLSLFL